jgi:hypothetical protein
MPSCLQAILLWNRRKWAAAFGGAIGTLLVVAIPTAMIANPIFGRGIAVTSWAWPVLIITSLLAGMLLATYVAVVPSKTADRQLKLGAAGGVLGFLAVGCPVCNKLVLIALGTTGALNFFAPIQPILALLGIVLLGYALQVRLKGESACALPKNLKLEPVSIEGSENGNS